MKTLWAVVFGVICGLLGAGIILVAIQPPRGVPITLGSPPTTAPLLVHVVGAVNHPGLVTVGHNSRVQDAVTEAGGLSPDADDQRLNLAAQIQDGAQIVVPTRRAPTSIASPRPGATATLTPAPRRLININLDSAAELDFLPGIGPVLSGRIVAYRKAHGPFLSVDQLLNVPGISQETYAHLKDWITVNAAP